METHAYSMFRRLGRGFRVFAIDGVELGVIDDLDPGPRASLWIRQKGVFRSHRTSVSMNELEAVNDHDGIVVLRIGSAAYEELVRAETDGRAPPVVHPTARDDGASADERLGGDPAARASNPEPASSGHLLFVGTAGGYFLVERDTAPGGAGALLELPDFPEARFRITKVGPSPLPGDRRRCAYLQPLR